VLQRFDDATERFRAEVRAFVRARLPEAKRATAMGVHQAVYAIGMFSGPWLSGLLAEAMGIRPMFGLTAAACLALGLFGARLLAEKRAGQMDETALEK